jgi:REP element-mobilizing transposase RayT
MAHRKIYDQQGLNYLTFTVVGWIDVFTRQQYRDILLKSLQYCQENKGLVLHAYVIMSNHLHLVAHASSEAKHGLSGLVGDFKQFTANKIIKAVQDGPESRKEWLLHMFRFHAKYNTNNKEFQLWIQGNHPTELWSPKVIQQKVNYLHNNPVRSGIVSDPSHYLYSSATNYNTNNEQGLIQLDLLDEMYFLE